MFHFQSCNSLIPELLRDPQVGRTLSQPVRSLNYRQLRRRWHLEHNQHLESDSGRGEGPGLALPHVRPSQCSKKCFRNFANGDLAMKALSGLILTAAIVTGCCTTSAAQTANTGALNGIVTDQTQAVVPNARIKVTSGATGQERSTVSSAAGAYVVPLLPPGSYVVEVSADGFKTALYPSVTVNVAETQTFNVPLAVGAATQVVTVSSNGEQVQMDTNALGRVIDSPVVEELPLVTRNFTQIVGLSAGVVQPVNNAAALGRGNGGMSFTGGFNVNGARNYDNNFQLDGIGANDMFATNDGGVAIPNPDAIEQFKVQTGQYDASFGRNAGANVDIVTKSGSNRFHGSLFEFFRNDDLNANDFFFKRAGLPRGKLKQNQFGGTIGGPVIKDKLLFFGSYQGTTQRNGVTTGCSSTFFGPPLSNDRSAAGIGALFAGQAGFYGGTAVLANGSNINPIALRTLQLKLPDGKYVIPTPVSINPSKSFATQGQYVQTGVCSFNENQYMGNGDYIQSTKSKFSSRFFDAQSNSVVPFTGGSTLSNPTLVTNSFVNYSLTYTYILNAILVNEAEFGFHSIHSSQILAPPYSYSSVGATVPLQDNAYPALVISGFTSVTGTSTNTPQKYYELRDSVTYSRGQHSIRAGVGAENVSMDIHDFASVAAQRFLSFPDFLIGLPAGPTTSGGNGAFIGNVYASIDLVGLLDRDYRAWNGSAYVTDEYRIMRNLTLNLGLRYERMGDIYDALGRNTSINPAGVDLTPPSSGTLAGYTVPSNFQGTVPAGVTQTGNKFGITGVGQNQLEPRIGFSWNLFPQSNNIVLRGGYGIYHSRLVGQQYLGLIAAPPFSQLRQSVGTANNAASEQNPFATLPAFPSFLPYSPTTALTPRILAANYRPAQTQQYSLNTQVGMPKSILFELGYVGARAVGLVRDRGINQAQLASPTNPINGVTTNTVANVQARVPYQGFSASGFQAVESEGASWYNSLQATLSKRLSKGSQFIAAYTWSRLLDTDGGNATETSAGNVVTLGNQNGQHSRYGPSDGNLEQRFVISYVAALPNLLRHDDGFGVLTSGWSVSGVTIIQSGNRLTISGTNATNVTGTTTDRAELVAGCSDAQVRLAGSSESKLTHFFNTACVTKTYPIVGDDHVATGFGDSGVGIVTGPGQQNFDISLAKRTPLHHLGDAGNLEFRTEFFNALNHAQFANPDINVSDPTFGQITATSVNPRVVQFALKLKF
jgi:hypothetical protein